MYFCCKFNFFSSFGFPSQGLQGQGAFQGQNGFQGQPQGFAPSQPPRQPPPGQAPMPQQPQDPSMLGCGTPPAGCPKNRYRSFDGSCNNLRNPVLGTPNTPYNRLLPARYGDGKCNLNINTSFKKFRWYYKFGRGG